MSYIKRFFRKTIVIDQNILPENYKTAMGVVSYEDIKKYEKDFKVNIILVDSSPKNTSGLYSGNCIVKKI